MNDFFGLLATSPSDLRLWGLEVEWIVMTVVWACVFAAKAVGYVLVLCLGLFVRQSWPSLYEDVKDGLRERPGLTLCAGILSQLALWIVTSVLVLTIVGIPLAIVAITAGILVSALGLAVLAEILGARLPMTSLHGHPERQLVMGLVLLLAISAIPVLGDAVVLVAFTAGSGAVTMAILSLHARRSTRRESVVTY